MKQDKARRAGHSLRGKLLLVALAPLLIVLIPVMILTYLVLSVLLHVLAWLVWNTRGIQLLYVYSNSPHWQVYVEQNILPRLPPRAIVLNWSHRKKWGVSLAAIVFWHFGGYREFNPMGLIFRPLRRVKVFRFFKPFRDFKHGKPEALHQMESEFFAWLNR